MANVEKNISSEEFIKMLEDMVKLMPEPKQLKPKLIMGAKKMDYFISKGYFYKGEVTRKGHENFDELLPYLHYS